MTGSDALEPGRLKSRMDVHGKRALVIGGAGGGIGRDVTRALGYAGANVAVADLDAESAQAAAEELRALGATAVPVQVDVTQSDELERMVEEGVEGLGGLDVVVTVVGGQVAHVPSVLLHEMEDREWDTMYELNLRYVARTLRLVLPRLLEQGTGGSIISIGSVTGIMGAPRQAAYGVMKAGLASLARTVAAEYSAQGIRMNVVAAGAIATAVANRAESGWVEEVPAGRYGTVDEVAAAVIYLASDDAAYLTGQQIVLDGGVSSRGPFES
jgi:3-oxoacyl-[acyl-carrier protein] reductase